MSRYHLELTGEVGGSNFNVKQTASLLAQYPGKPVTVLIDSPGGSLAQGLSIADEFRSHGDVTVHLRSMCASAATIASMGAKRVEIAPDGFYLVHKVSMMFYDWASRNADELTQFIEALQKEKDNLDTLDQAVAATYAKRCKRPVKDILKLMEHGKWLSAEQAREWGFVDEISGEKSDKAPEISNSYAASLLASGLPLPPVPIAEESSGFLEQIKTTISKTIKSIFMSNPTQTPAPEPQPQAQTTAPAQQPQAQTPEPVPAPAPEPEPQPQQPQNAGSDLDSLKAENEELKKRIEALEKQPGATTASVVNTPPPAKPAEQKADSLQQFLNASKEVADIYDSLP